MLAFIGNLSPLEIVVVAVLAILIFGKRLPEVAGRAMYQLRRMRQSMEDLRRETGIDSEFRSIQRNVQRAAWEAEARYAERADAPRKELAQRASAESASEEKPDDPDVTPGPASP